MVALVKEGRFVKATPNPEIILTYKKLQYLRKKGLDWGGEHLTNESLEAWQSLIEEDAEARQMDNLAHLYFEHEKRNLDLAEKEECEDDSKNCMKSVTSPYERLKFLRIFGFVPGGHEISREELLSWEALVNLDVEAANLDYYADARIREFK